jgi:transcription elongation GreA/GreB family factor
MRTLDAFAAHLEKGRSSAEHELEALDEAAANETKSSAGDKYETAREMFSQARDLQRRIREEAEAGLAWIERQRAEASRVACGPGALVETSEGWLLLGPVPVKIEVDGVAVQGVSAQSPLGQALKGARAGETRIFRERALVVLRFAASC